MTDAERRAEVLAFFAALAERVIALPESQDAGSFTVHIKGRIPRTVDWNMRDDASRWAERRESA